MLHDLSGTLFLKVTPEIAREAEEMGVPLRCERCGAMPQTVEVAG